MVSDEEIEHLIQLFQSKDEETRSLAKTTALSIFDGDYYYCFSSIGEIEFSRYRFNKLSSTVYNVLESLEIYGAQDLSSLLKLFFKNCPLKQSN